MMCGAGKDCSGVVEASGTEILWRLGGARLSGGRERFSCVEPESDELRWTLSVLKCSALG